MASLFEVLSAIQAGLQAALDAWLTQIRLVLVGLAWVALGSALGGTARFFVSGIVGRHVGETFPWGTMTVNVSGAFAIGFVAAQTTHHAFLQKPGMWELTVVGFLGSYTTVSSFSLQTLALFRDDEPLLAAGNIGLSLVLCLSAVTVGYAVGMSVGGATIW